MNYEALLDEAHQEGLTVKEKPLKYNNGRIKGKRIAIRKDIETTGALPYNCRRYNRFIRLPESQTGTTSKALGV